MKKVLPIIVIAVMVLSIVGYCFLGSNIGKNSGDCEVLRIYNWEEYISESDANKIEWNDYVSGEYTLSEDDEYIDVIYLFESYCRQVLNRNVRVEYSTFGTNENMYNELNLSKKEVGGSVSYSYDLVCPSEYMLLKMIREDMLEPLDRTKITNYDQNSSEYIRNLFKNQQISCEDGSTRTLYDYATCYMWGTMGYVYNPEHVTEADANHWSLLWKDEYKGKGTIKDSVRDSYILAIGYVYQEELSALKAKYDRGELTRAEYNAQLTAIYNRTDKESVERVGKVLTELKDKIYGYEVDSGKKDMAQGKISINFAWSGDAVYTMDVAEEEGTYLSYAIPEEGSNIFFDGWAMPKGANKELAQIFINFISTPESGCMNMNYIGYTSSLAGDTMFENAVDWYGTYVLVKADAEDEDTVLVDGEPYYEEYFGDLDQTTRQSMLNADGTYNLIYPVYDDEYNVIGKEESENVTLYQTDLSYFFNTVATDSPDYDSKAYILWTDQINRQATTQYPSEDMIARCTVMKCFSDDEIRELNDMWETAKVGNVSLVTILIVLGIIIVSVVVAIVLIKLYQKDLIKFSFGHKNLKFISSSEDKK